MRLARGHRRRHHHLLDPAALCSVAHVLPPRHALLHQLAFVAFGHALSCVHHLSKRSAVPEPPHAPAHHEGAELRIVAVVTRICRAGAGVIGPAALGAREQLEGIVAHGGLRRQPPARPDGSGGAVGLVEAERLAALNDSRCRHRLARGLGKLLDHVDTRR